MILLQRLKSWLGPAPGARVGTLNAVEVKRASVSGVVGGIAAGVLTFLIDFLFAVTPSVPPQDVPLGVALAILFVDVLRRLWQGAPRRPGPKPASSVFPGPPAYPKSPPWTYEDAEDAA